MDHEITHDEYIAEHDYAPLLAPAEVIATRDALSIEGHIPTVYSLGHYHSFVYYCRFSLDRLRTGSIQLYPVDEEGRRRRHGANHPPF